MSLLYPVWLVYMKRQKFFAQKVLVHFKIHSKLFLVLIIINYTKCHDNILSPYRPFISAMPCQPKI